MLCMGTHLAPFALLPEISRADVAVASSAWRIIGRAPRAGVFFVVFRVFARPPSFCDGRERWWRRGRCEVVWRQAWIRVRFGARYGGWCGGIRMWHYLKSSDLFFTKIIINKNPLHVKI